MTDAKPTYTHVVIPQVDRAAELIRDLSWRATRYATEGKRVEHDVMVEALNEVRAANGMERVTECTCKFPQDETLPGCVCRACGPPWRDTMPKPDPADFARTLGWNSWMALCPRCGSKRCTGAGDHRNPCGNLFRPLMSDATRQGFRDLADELEADQ